MLIECPTCQASVTTRVIGKHQSNDKGGKAPRLTSLLECPSCKSTLVANQDYLARDKEGIIWSNPVRIWPQPPRPQQWQLPEIVQSSFEETQRCFDAGAYLAVAVMGSRVLEGLCVHFNTQSKILYKGLKELCDMEVIDKRLFEWSEMLTKRKVIRTQVVTDKVTKQDADDLLEFLTMVFDYAFVIRTRYDAFLTRAVNGK